jgi:hypothetical protein
MPVRGWRTNANGVVTAAAFAVGFLFATFTLADVVPAKIKVGDVEVKLQQARQRGAEEGRIRGLEAALRSARMSRSVTCQSRGSKQP